MIRCSEEHSVDVSKEGYVHLLPAGRLQRKNEHARGDSDASVRARRAFFEAGHYAPQLRAVALCVRAALGDSDEGHTAAETRDTLGAKLDDSFLVGFEAGDNAARRHVLDAACGEGAYARAVGESRVDNVQLWGVDLSALAVRYAAKRQPASNFAVASLARLPLPDATLDVVLSVFAPLALEEFSRVLKTGGALVVASPGPRHHEGLKNALYAAPKEATLDAGDASKMSTPLRNDQFAAAGFVRETARRETTRETYAPIDAANLLAMTPFVWKAPREQQLKVATQPLTTDIDFLITTYRKSQ